MSRVAGSDEPGESERGRGPGRREGGGAGERRRGRCGVAIDVAVAEDGVPDTTGTAHPARQHDVLHALKRGIRYLNSIMGEYFD